MIPFHQRPIATITKLCKFCNKEFQAPLKEHNRGKAHFCSQSCASSGKRTNHQHNLKCACCSATFYRAISKHANSKSGLFFCSRTCKDKGQSMQFGLVQIWPDHYGTTQNYRQIALKDQPHKCNRCGYNEHPEILQVHHADRDRTNNSIQNLEVLCPNCHRVEHMLN